MSVHPNLNHAVATAAKKLHDFGYEIHTETWHAQPIKQMPHMVMLEVLNHSFTAPIPKTLQELQKDVRPNLPWADEHFAERLSGKPLNPPPSHVRWPFASKGNKSHVDGKALFSHTYPERIWPKFAGRDDDKLNQGIRYPYGDFTDLLMLLNREPFTRQAYLPIFFPEDTGAVFKGRIPCSLGYHFIRRHQWLHCVYGIRSCDFLRHFRDDIYFAARKVLWVLEQMRHHSPVEWKDVHPGTLKMDITSLHCFKGEKGQLKVEAAS